MSTSLRLWVLSGLLGLGFAAHAATASFADLSALPATVMRKPFSVRYCFNRLRMRVSSSTTRRCGASSCGIAEPSVIVRVSVRRMDKPAARRTA